MKQTPLKRKAPLKRSAGPRVSSLKSTTGGKGKRSGPISPASKEQRAKCREAQCLVCRMPGSDPAHLIDRSLLKAGQDDARAVVPLCRSHHDAYDGGSIDLLPWLEPDRREELAFAVLRFGLMATVRRVTNEREAA